MVSEAATEFEDPVFTEGNVLGGRKAITSTNFGTAGNPMFDERAGLLAATSRAPSSPASSRTTSRPTSTPTSGVFGFPPAEAGGDNPVLGGGDLATLLND